MGRLRGAFERALSAYRRRALARLWARNGRRAAPEDVVAAYRLLLGRPPDPEGLALYTRLAETGLTIDRLREIFLGSDEYRLLTAPDSEVRTVDLGGYVVCCRASESDFGRAIVETGRYEPHVCEAVRQHVRVGDTVVDVGANVGCISLLAAGLVGPGGSVVAVEPNPENLQMLYAGIVANGASNVRVLPYAASDRRQVFSLAGGTSNTHLVAARPAEDRSTYAQSVVLDEELADLARIDFVKIDVEGHEPLALRGFAGLLRKHRPTLLTEFNPYFLRRNQGIEPVAYARGLLDEHGYRRLEVISPFGDAASFDEPERLMAYWRARNAEIAGRGLVPDGMLHFDLIARR